MLTRAKKVEYIKNLSSKFQAAKATFVVDYKGLNVEQVTDLRKQLFASNTEFTVVKNTLAKIALNDHESEKEAIAADFVGTNALVFAGEDPSASAKVLAKYAKDNEFLKLKSGVMEGKRLDKAEINYLATLPGKDELRAKLLSVFNAPATQFVRVINAVPSGFLNVLNAYKDKEKN